MLHLMRKHAQSWLIKLALGAIVVVFVFWGVGSYRAQKGNRIALVNGAPIARDEFRGVYDQLMETYRRQFGNALDEKFLRSLNIKKQALDQIINRRLLLQEATRLNFRVTDEELFRTIERVPAFHRDGRFDPRLYQRVLARNRMTPEMYEESKKNEILVDKLQGLILGSIKVSDAEAFEAYKWFEKKVSLDYVLFKPSAYKNVEVIPEEIETYFSKHKKTYEIPAKVKVQYLRIGFKEFKAQAKTLAFDRAEEIYEACYRAGNISDAAEASQLKVHETESFPRAGPVKGIKEQKRFAKTAFDLNENEVGEPIKLSDGYYILQPIAKEPAKIPDLKQVEKKVRQNLIKAKQSDQAKQDAEEFLKDLKGGAGFQKAVASQQLKARSTDFFGRFGAIPEIGSEPEIREAAFSLSPSKPFPDAVIKGKQGYYYVLRFKARQEAGPDRLEDKKSQIKSSLLLQKRQGAVGEFLAGLRKKSKVTIQEGFLD